MSFKLEHNEFFNFKWTFPTIPCYEKILNVVYETYLKEKYVTLSKTETGITVTDGVYEYHLVPYNRGEYVGVRIFKEDSHTFKLKDGFIFYVKPDTKDFFNEFLDSCFIRILETGDNNALVTDGIEVYYLSTISIDGKKCIRVSLSNPLGIHAPDATLQSALDTAFYKNVKKSSNAPWNKNVDFLKLSSDRLSDAIEIIEYVKKQVLEYLDKNEVEFQDEEMIKVYADDIYFIGTFTKGFQESFVLYFKVENLNVYLRASVNLKTDDYTQRYVLDSVYGSKTKKGLEEFI